MLFLGLISMAVVAVAVTIVLHTGANSQPVSNSYPEHDYGGDEEMQSYNERKNKEGKERAEKARRNNDNVSNMGPLPCACSSGGKSKEKDVEEENEEELEDELEEENEIEETNTKNQTVTKGR